MLLSAVLAQQMIGRVTQGNLWTLLDSLNLVGLPSHLSKALSSE
jgi:hypothetical protein